MENKPLTPEEVADILQITKNTVYELIKRGDLLSYKVGRKVRVDSKDLEAYIKKGKHQQAISATASEYQAPLQHSTATPITSVPSTTIIPANSSFVISGQDTVLDILANFLQKQTQGVPILRSYIGSYNGLMSLYHGTTNITACHLWDGDQEVYNYPYVRRLVPGTSCVIIHLVKRIQGFYVLKGNPKKIKGWLDLSRDDVTMINREKGSGSRILLDEHLRQLFLSSKDMNGYENEQTSHLLVASIVARQKADVGIGCKNVADGIDNLDFIPLQEESYDLVIKKEEMNHSLFKKTFEILNSTEFKDTIHLITGYDVSDTGRIVHEI